MLALWSRISLGFYLLTQDIRDLDGWWPVSTVMSPHPLATLPHPFPPSLARQTMLSKGGTGSWPTKIYLKSFLWL